MVSLLGKLHIKVRTYLSLHSTRVLYLFPAAKAFPATYRYLYDQTKPLKKKFCNAFKQDRGSASLKCGSGLFSLDADPDPNFHSDVDPDPMWIRIRLLINVMRICNYWSTLHPRLHLKLQFFIVSVHGLSCLH
jgi:hypothetical protein